MKRLRPILFAASLSLLLVLIFTAAVTPILSLRLQGDADGAGSNSWYAVRNYGGFSANLTNGTLIVQSNSVLSTGPGSNDVRGAGSILAAQTKSNSFNTITTPANIVASYSDDMAAGTSNVLTLSASRGGIIAALSKRNTSVNTLNSLTPTSGGFLFAAGDPGTGTGTTNSVTGLPHGGFIGIGGGSLHNVFASPAGSLIVIGNAGTITYAGSNSISGAVGSIMGINSSSGGGWNHVGASGAVGGFRNLGGTNIFTSSGGFMIGQVTSGGLNLVSGQGAVGLLQSANSNSLVVSGQSAMLIADATVAGGGGASVTGIGGFQWGAGYTNPFPYRAMFGYATTPILTVTTNKVGIGTNDPTSGYALDVVGNGQVSGILDVGQFVNAAHGTFTMSTGTVTLATSSSTNLFTNSWSYVFTDAPIGSETNTTMVVSNAAHVFISFGAAMSANASGAGTMTCHVVTNDVVCSVIRIEAPAQGTATFETGFKEFAISLPANCRVGLAFGVTTAQNINVKNVCLNIKGAN